MMTTSCSAIGGRATGGFRISLYSGPCARRLPTQGDDEDEGDNRDAGDHCDNDWDGIEGRARVGRRPRRDGPHAHRERIRVEPLDDAVPRDVDRATANGDSLGHVVSCTAPRAVGEHFAVDGEIEE